MRGLRTDCAATRVVALSAALATAGVVHGQTVTFYVDDDAPPGGDGLSWETAFNDLSDALDAAGTTSSPFVRVAGGLYFPGRGTADCDASFVIDHTPTQSAVTMGLAAALGVPRGIAALGGSGPTGAIVPGEDGRVQVQSAYIFRMGGGFAGLANPADPNLQDPAAFTTVLSADYAQDDSDALFSRNDNGKRVVYVGDGFHFVTVWGLVIEGGFDIAAGSAGAGMYVDVPRNLSVERCVFRRNTASDGGALSGGAWQQSFRECRFEDNVAASRGGAVFNLNGGVLTNCRLVGNRAVSGGAIAGYVRTNGCVLVGNTAVDDGGAGYVPANLTMRNCTVAGNRAGRRAGGLYVDGVALFDPAAANTILWANTDASGLTASAQVSAGQGMPWVERCVVKGAESDDTVIGENPLFVDEIGPDGDLWSGDEDLQLMAGSPAIDRGSGAAIGSDEELSFGPLHRQGLITYVPIDTAGGFRWIGPDVDIGAFENQESTVACSVADVTIAGSPWPGLPDGRVTGVDLTYFVNMWVARWWPTDLTTANAGIGDPGYGVPDGRVTAIDLGYFVNAWLEGCE